MKHFTQISDITDPLLLVEKALKLKNSSAIFNDIGKNKTIGLLFFNPSFRTLLSTQKAAQNIQLNCLVIDSLSNIWKLEMEDNAIMNKDSQEHLKDAIGVMQQYCDIIGVRTFPSLISKEKDYSEQVLSKIKKYSNKPIISLESTTLHPLQSLADMITIQELKTKAKPKVVLSWAPHPKALPQAVSNSFLEWANKFDYELVVTHPKGYELDNKFTQGVDIEYNQNKAFENADFIYSKNWSSYSDYGKILSQDTDWTITSDKMKLTNKAHFMHCMPIRRNVIATDEVIDNSIIFLQAKNREISAQVVLEEIIKSL